MGNDPSAFERSLRVFGKVRPVLTPLARAAGEGLGVRGLLLLGLLLVCTPTSAQPPETVRELFVPFDDLHVLLAGPTQRVLLPRAEYDKLLQQAAKNAPQLAAPAKALVVAADYEVRVDRQWADIASRLSIDVLTDGLVAVPLDLGPVGLRRAWLDGRAAPLGAAAGRPLSLFVEGRGRHELKLDVLAPLETTAARQLLPLRLPAAPTARLRLSVPGDVEISDGARVISRQVDPGAGLTRFELLPSRGPTTLVMSLNSHLAREERLVTARSFLVDEITQANERLRATVALDVLRRAVDQFRIALPDGFEVIHAESPTLARWAVEGDGARRVLVVRLREPAVGRLSVGVVAQRTAPPLASWSFPRLDVQDVAGQAAMLRLLVDRRLRTDTLAAEGLIGVDAAREFSLPADPERPSPDTCLEPVAAYYAAQADWRLAGRFSAPPARLAAIAQLTLTLSEPCQQLDAALTVIPEVEKLFALDIALPADWHVTEVKSGDAALPFEVLPAGARRRMHVTLLQPASAETRCKVQFRAVRTPAAWLGNWSTAKVAFPRCEVLGAARNEGTIAVVARDDMTVRPERLEQLTPLDQPAGERPSEAGLGFRCEGAHYAAALIVERTAPRVTARTFSFARVEPDLLAAHFQIDYQIQNARTRRLALLLPAETPKALEIRGLDGVALKESSSRDAAGGLRRWDVLLVESRRGPVRLAVDFQQPLAGRTEFAVPLVRAADVLYQSGLVAVEGSADLDVQVATHAARPVDVGQLADAQYQPGRRLLGAWGFVGDRSDVAAGAQVRIARRPGCPLCAAVVEKASLYTVLSAEGTTITTAEFRLRTKTPLVELRLPAGSSLWSAACDDRPLAPQRDGEAVLLSLSAGDGPREVQFTYQTPVARVPRGGWLELDGPELLVRSEHGAAATRVPAADLQWDVELPDGYRIARTSGTVTANPGDRPAIERPWPAAVMTLGALAAPFVLPAAREYARHPRLSTSAPTAEAPKSEPVPESFDLHAPKAAAELNADTLKLDERPSVPGAKPAEKPAEKSAEKAAQRPARAPPPPAAPAAAPRPAGGTAASLAGARSLAIDTRQQQSGRERLVRFRSLGEEPRLKIRLVPQRRFDTLAWAVALAVVFAGLLLTGRRAGVKVRYLILVMLAATVVPLPLDSVGLVEIGNAAFFAALALVPYYLVVGFVRLLVSAAPAAATAALLLVLAVPVVSHAEPRDDFSGRLLQILEPTKPVPVPDDVILVPYQPSAGPPKADRLLVSYAKYVELWNRAYPDKKIDAGPAPAEFALAGASYRTTLAADEHLTVSGRLEIDVYTERAALVPLGLENAVFTRTVLDGKPAQVQSMRIEKPAAQTAAEANTAMVVLHVSGRGRHVLELDLRVALQHQGGWRVASARIPHAPASLLAVVAPEAHTELRLGSLGENATLHTDRSDQTLETVLGEAGALRLQWRPKLAEAQVDQTLKVHTTATLDVVDEGLRLAARLELEFRGAQRDAFRLSTPENCLVERVEGENVRGWEPHSVAGRQSIDVRSLKPARDREMIRLWLARRTPLGRGPAEFELPTVEVEGSALSDGLVVLRRSPTLELRVVSAAGLTRTDLPGDSAGTAGADPSPLGLRAVQAYRFPAAGYRLQLASEPIAPKLAGRLESVLRISEFEREVETCVRVDVRDRAIHRMGLWVPDDFELRKVVAPGRFHWALETVDRRRLLNVYLAEGRSGQFDVVVRGKLGQSGAATQVELPRFELRDAERQQGQFAVQVDPDYDLAPAGLENCRTVLLERVYAWLRPEQRESTRLAIDYDRPDYRGTLRLTARQPAISCLSITNVRVTDRAIEETVLLEFTIRNAGVRQLSFLLPAGLERPRIQVPMLRQQSIEPTSDKPGAPLRVRLELQDPRMDTLLVLVENDRVPSAAPIVPPIPVVETGRVERQLVAVETSGRDEVLVEAAEGLEPLGRQQKQWELLTRYLRGGATLAYQVTPGAERPRLVLRTRDREAVQTVGARIWLGETSLVMDAHGAYRASITYRLDNSTEQFLAVELPPGAELWTAHVAGEPVKPIHDPHKPDGRRILVPLVKTALGDADYPVVLKYAGKLPAPGVIRRMEFPLVRTVNIQVARSLLRLSLPETHRWFNFSDKMRLADGEDELEAERLDSDAQRAERLMEVLRHGDEYAKVRATSVLERLVPGLSATLEASRRRQVLNEKYARQQQVAAEVQQELRKAAPQKAKAQPDSNRQGLADLYAQQQSKAARNVVRGYSANFDQPAKTPRHLQKGGVVIGREFSQAGQRQADDDPFDSTAPARIQWQEAAKAEATDKDTLARYREQMDRRNAQRGAPVPADESRPSDAAAPAAAQTGASQPSTGLSSLDVTIPERDLLFCFTTPRGEVEMSAWGLSEPLVGRFWRSVAALGLMAVGLLLLRTTRKRKGN